MAATERLPVSVLSIGLTRAAEIVQAEIERAEALMNIEDSGGPVFSREQVDAGICALRTVLEAIQREASAGAPVGAVTLPLSILIVRVEPQAKTPVMQCKVCGATSSTGGYHFAGCALSAALAVGVAGVVTTPSACVAESLRIADVPAFREPSSMETAPGNREVLVFNDYYGWYRSRATEHEGRVLWPLYGLLGRQGGVWYPVPSSWMELPPPPEGRKWCGVGAMPQVPDSGTYGVTGTQGGES